MEDEWDFYFTKIDDALGSIFVNLSLETRAPVAGYASAVYVRLFMRQPRPDGLSSQEEFDALAAVDDALENEMRENHAALYAGRATYNGLRDLFYYVRDAGEVSETIHRVMANFPEYKFEVGSREDPNWEAYGEYLLPSARDRERMGNRKLCEALKEHGDPLTQPREIDHWAYFLSADARDAFLSRTSALGYELREISDPDQLEDGAYREMFGAQIFRVNIPSRDEIDDTTLELLDIAVEFGGKYDGWECPVEKSLTPLN